MNNTALLLARLQFGVTLTYHFWFVALTLGLSILIALMETRYVLTGHLGDKKLARFFGNFFLVNYAVAIVTGLVNEFQFGMNWSEYSKFVGSVFGAPVALEALTAFFVESVAIGIWVYGWDKISGRAHLLFIWLIALSSNYSAFWILSANAFMQHPVGFTAQNGRVELTDLSALVFNPYLSYQYSHTVLSGLVTAGFFIMAVSAFYLLRNQHFYLFKRSFKIGLVCALTATALVIVTGHFYNQFLARVQPMKMAASEALWETAAPAPFVVFAIIDRDERRNYFQVTLPAGLSILAYNALNTPVKGMNDLQTEYTAQFGQADYIPPVILLFWSFRIMVGIGMWLMLLVAISFWYWRKNQIEAHPFLLKAIIWSLPLPYIAITAGWLITEAGRQPWLVYGLLLTEQGVSRIVPAASVGLSLGLYTIVYALVAAAALYIARKILLTGPES